MSFKEWKNAIANAAWDIDFSEFCRRAGFTEDSYAERKWRDWRKLAEALASFEASTLERVVLPPAKAVS